MADGVKSQAFKLRVLRPEPWGLWEGTEPRISEWREQRAEEHGVGWAPGLRTSRSIQDRRGLMLRAVDGKPSENYAWIYIFRTLFRLLGGE